MRIPCLASSNDRHSVQMMITSFDGPYPPAMSSGWASHHALPAAKPSVVASGIHFAMLAIHPAPAVDEMLAMAPPSGMWPMTSSARWRMPTKFTSMVSTSENGGPGSPAQLNSASIRPPILSTAALVASGSRRSTTWWLATVHRWLLQVKHVHLGTEVHELSDRRRAHAAATPPAHDDPHPLIAPHRRHFDTPSSTNERTMTRRLPAAQYSRLCRRHLRGD